MNHEGIKCVRCVFLSLDSKDMSTDRPVQEGVDGAKAAVVIYRGDALCVEHFHERMQDDMGAAYEKAILS